MLIGLVIGRWWAMAIAAAVWAVLLITGTSSSVAGALTFGAALAAVNAAVGIAVHKGFAWLVRSVPASN